MWHGAMQVAGYVHLKPGNGRAGLEEALPELGIPPVLSYGTCTDTGRLADLLAAIASALGDVSVTDLPVAR